MNEFALIFRNSIQSDVKPSPAQIQEVMNAWMSWMGSIAAQNKLADKGNRLSMSNSKTVSAGNMVTDGPFVEIKEFINGYILVKTETIDEAVEIAKECPILKIGGKVEVRKIIGPNDLD